MRLRGVNLGLQPMDAGVSFYYLRGSSEAIEGVSHENMKAINNLICPDGLEEQVLSHSGALCSNVTEKGRPDNILELTEQGVELLDESLNDEHINVETEEYDLEEDYYNDRVVAVRASAEPEEVLEDEDEDEDETLDQLSVTYAVDTVDTDDPISLYLREMSRVPLLTSEEEVSLAKLIERGRHAQELLKENDCTPAEYARFHQQIEEQTTGGQLERAAPDQLREGTHHGSRASLGQWQEGRGTTLAASD